MANLCIKQKFVFFSGPNELSWNKVAIHAGDLVWNEQSGLEQSRSVKSHKIHPDYQPNDGFPVNDLCLLTLDKGFEFKDNITAIGKLNF